MFNRMISVFVLAAFAHAVNADDVRLYQHGEIPDAEDVARMLEPEPKLKFRSIRLLPGSKAGAHAVAPSSPKKSESPKSFALQLQFGFDSHQLTAGIKSQLDAVAKGIRIATPKRVLVEGHADAHGSADYNMALSHKRALAVKQYLVDRHNVNPDILVVSGEGEDNPLNVTDPFAPENRRVQFQAG